MSTTIIPKPRLLFLFSDTGGGHRSSTEAIIEALKLEYDTAIEHEMVDFLQEYYPWPYRSIPKIYCTAVNYPRLYGAFWSSTNGKHRNNALMESHGLNFWLRHKNRLMVKEHPADLAVLTHYMAIKPMLWIPPRHRPKLAVIVTDLVSIHATWFDTRIDYYVVPTEIAYHKAIEQGIDPNKIKLIGLPVADRFCQPTQTTQAVRQQYGWPLDKPLILIVGGGEGMGPIEQHARAIAESGLDVGLVIITGRNQALKARLSAEKWPIPTFIYGFVKEMHHFMHGCNILVTKAGPSTICEGLNAGLPILLYSYVPGQEEGNVTYLTNNGAGYYTPEPAHLVHQLRHWLITPRALDTVRQSAQQLARPKAAREIAHFLALTVGATQPTTG